MVLYEVKTKLRKSDKWRPSGRRHTKEEAKTAQRHWKKKGWYAQIVKEKV